VTDFCQGGELFDKIIEEKYFTEAKAAKIIKQVLSAIAYCHKRSLVHCDLKPENIMVEKDDVVRVIDFGNSALCAKDKKLSSKFGSVYYVAPEVLGGSYNEKCDVWSIGVILFLLLCGKPPFNGSTDQIILKKVY
jgi:calcium-dependent protein kinase